MRILAACAGVAIVIAVAVAVLSSGGGEAVRAQSDGGGNSDSYEARFPTEVLSIEMVALYAELTEIEYGSVRGYVPELMARVSR